MSSRPGGDNNAWLEGSTRALLDSFSAISSDLDTHSVLSRLVESACTLTGSAAGALGIVDHSGQLGEYVTYGLDPRELELAGGPPPDKGLQSTIRVRGTTFGVLFLTDKVEGHAYTGRDELLVEGLCSVAGFVIENAQAYGLSERRRRWLELFGDLSDLLEPPITLDDALERITEAVRRTWGAYSASIVQVPEQGDPIVAVVSGEVYDLTAQERSQLDQAVRAVVDTGEVMDLPFRDSRAFLAPLGAHLTLPGVILVISRPHGVEEQLEERQLLASFANHAAAALDRTQALEDREQMAVVSDRDRIARDLHDVVIQRLFATGLHLQSIRSAATTPELRERIDQSVKDLDQTIRDIRGTIFELQVRPQSSLRTAVRDLVQEYVPVLGFSPSVHTHGPVDSSVEQNLQQQLVAVLREALSNVARHAGASSASVDLHVTPTHLRLRVSDNGTGAPEERRESGLRNARRRAVLLGGTLDLWPNEPCGTSFLWSVPYRAHQSDGRER